MRTGELRAVLRGRDFRRLYATRLISQLSDGVFQVALAGFVFFSPEQQTSPARAATAFAVLLLPYSVVGPFAGVFIDRWSRRQILLCSPLVRAVLVCVIAALLWTTGPAFYLAALLVLGVNRFFLAALSAALPHVVTRPQLVLANSLSVTSGTIIAFAGAGVAYLLRLVFGADRGGTALILVCSALGYVLAAGAARTLGRDQLGPDRGPERDTGHAAGGAGHGPDLPPLRRALGDVLRGLADGARHIRRHRPAALALTVISLHRFLYGIVLIMAGLLYRNYFTTDPDEGLRKFVLFLGLSGAGFFAGAVITPVVVRRVGKQAWIVALLGLAAVSVVAACAPFREAPLAIGAFLLGLASQGVKISVDVILQESVLDAYRGRVFSVYDMLFNGMFVAAAAVAAITLPGTGRSYAVVAALFAGWALTAVGYRLATRSRPAVPATASDRAM
ncbi:MFS transporter [Actinomadura scrupuli]|uniref:MFS transporter n=1 Tax=Actinomadura scrupuli TaxID=559629 RepID=UPI003D96689C